MDNFSTNHCLSHFLKGKRIQKGISIKAAADYIGTDPNVIADFELGLTNIAPETVYDLCLLYRWPISFIQHKFINAFECSDEKTKRIVQLALNFPVAVPSFDCEHTQIHARKK